jgi:hypothetical protein
MDTIASIFEAGKRRTATAQVKLTEAYCAVFEGRGGPQDAEIVLVDLARNTGYLHITMPDPTNTTNQLWFNEGRRSVMGRIMQFVALPGEAKLRLAEAVRMEDAASQMEQEEL